MILVAFEVPYERGIDAHRRKVMATVEAVHHHRGSIDGEGYDLVYYPGDRPVRTRLSLPGGLTVNARVCLEFDATKPQAVRPCGERYELFTTIVVRVAAWLGAILAGSGLTRLLRSFQRRKAAWFDPDLVVAMVARDISRGTFAAGAPLPGATELAALYKAPVWIVQEAVALLVRAGLVTRDGRIRSRGRRKG